MQIYGCCVQNVASVVRFWLRSPLNNTNNAANINNDGNVNNNNVNNNSFGLRPDLSDNA
ncbi:MAG: hypothetical protein LBL38_03745 [Lactobacillales bacterium]|nr:hypothetical protein [Lactobacillales bacterium]